MSNFTADVLNAIWNNIDCSTDLYDALVRDQEFNSDAIGENELFQIMKAFLSPKHATPEVRESLYVVYDRVIGSWVLSDGLFVVGWYANNDGGYNELLTKIKELEDAR